MAEDIGSAALTLAKSTNTKVTTLESQMTKQNTFTEVFATSNYNEYVYDLSLGNNFFTEIAYDRPQVITLEVTVPTTITTTGNAMVGVVAAGITGFPKNILIPVVSGDDQAAVFTKIYDGLSEDSDFAAAFSLTGSDNTIYITKTTLEANDSTFAMSLNNGSCAGITLTNSVEIQESGTKTKTIKFTNVPATTGLYQDINLIFKCTSIPASENYPSGTSWAVAEPVFTKGKIQKINLTTCDNGVSFVGTV